MESALDPWDLVKHTERMARLRIPPLDTETLAQNLELIAQEAADLINADPKQEFLYTNPCKWKSPFPKQMLLPEANSSDSSDFTLATTSLTTSSEEDNESGAELWSSIKDFEFHDIVHQINAFIQTWKLSPATKFIVIGMDRIENKLPFGIRHFVEAHFSKPTPKCPYPLAVAKVYFQVSVSQLLPSFYPVNVIYRFEGYKSKFYALGERKLRSNRFQRFYIDSILHIKLAFYAKLCECRNPLAEAANQ